MSDMPLNERVRHHLGFLLRQNSEGDIPQKVPMSDYLKTIIDEPTAQKIYDQLLADNNIKPD